MASALVALVSAAAQAAQNESARKAANRKPDLPRQTTPVETLSDEQAMGAAEEIARRRRGRRSTLLSGEGEFSGMNVGKQRLLGA